MISGKSNRSKTLYNNILGSGIYKAINVVFNLLIVRYAILLVGEENYGIWLALLSFLTWFSAFEVGISSSLRNKITSFFSEQKYEQIKEAIVRGYKSLLIIYSLLLAILLLCSYLFPIESLLLPDGHSVVEFKLTFKLCCFFYFGHFITFFVNSVLLATHKTKQTYLITAIQNGVLLAGLLVSYHFNYSPSLLLFCLWFSSVPFLVWAVSGIVSYKVLFRKLNPGLFDVLSAQPIKPKSTGANFFLIQLCTLIIYSTDNVILVNLLSGSDVAVYNVVFKYFNILIVLFNLVLLPYWASFADAYKTKDLGWISTHIKRLVVVWLGILMLGVLMFFISSWALSLWIGKDLNTDNILLVFMLISILLTAWNSIFSYFLNGISRVRLQMKLLLLAAIINIPLSIYLVKSMGSGGAILATCFSLVPAAVILPLQYKSVIGKMNSKTK